MKYPIKKIRKRPFKNKERKAMTFFLWTWYANEELMKDKVLVFHETLHYIQQRETGFIFGWLIWLILIIFNILIARDVYWDHPWEREAYVNQSNLDYLKTRKAWAWVKYIGKKRKRDKRGNYLNHIE